MPDEPPIGRPEIKENYSRPSQDSSRTVYGIIIQPTAPMGIYGVVSNVARGHVISAILFGMVAMDFTAISSAEWHASTPAPASPTLTSGAR